MRPAGEKAAPRWTPEEDERLLTICAERRMIGFEEWSTILGRFPGRTFLGLRQRYLTLRKRAAGVPDERRSTRARVIERRLASMQAPIMPAALPQHASLTAFVFGDPLPGRSALDRRMAQQ